MFIKILKRIGRFFFRNRTPRQTIAKNTIWLGTGQIGGRLLRSLIIVYAARVLGTSGWGAFSYAISLATFLTIFVDMGINVIISREAAKKTDVDIQSKIISTSFFIKIALLILAGSIIILVAPHFSKVEEAKILFPIVAFVLAFDTLREFGFSIIHAKEKMEWGAGLFTITNIVIVATGFLFLKISPTPLSFTWSYAIGTGVGVMATFYVIRKELKKILTHFSRSHIKPIFASAWPFAISSLLGLLMLNTDILLIGYFLSAKEVGLYSAGNRVVQILYMIPSVLTVSVFPTMARLANTNNEKFKEVLEKVLILLLMISIPLAIGGIILAEPIINLIFGPEYIGTKLSFQFLMATLAIDFCAVVLNNAIFAYNKQKNLTINAGIGGLVNISGDLALIPAFGIAGSAAATLLAQIISNAYLWRTMNKIIRFSVIGKIRNILIATLFMSIVIGITNWLHTPILATVLVGIITYFATLAWLKEPIIKEVALLRNQI